MKESSNFGNIMYVLAIVFVLLWAISYIGYDFRGVIHILLGLAIIAILLRVIKTV